VFLNPNLVKNSEIFKLKTKDGNVDKIMYVVCGILLVLNEIYINKI